MIFLLLIQLIHLKNGLRWLLKEFKKIPCFSLKCTVINAIYKVHNLRKRYVHVLILQILWNYFLSISERGVNYYKPNSR